MCYNAEGRAALLTISFQSVKAAAGNPVDAIRHGQKLAVPAARLRAA